MTEYGYIVKLPYPLELLNSFEFKLISKYVSDHEKIVDLGQQHSLFTFATSLCSEE